VNEVCDGSGNALGSSESNKYLILLPYNVATPNHLHTTTYNSLLELLLLKSPIIANHNRLS
jgi:hypothetical protein